MHTHRKEFLKTTTQHEYNEPNYKAHTSTQALGVTTNY